LNGKEKWCGILFIIPGVILEYEHKTKKIAVLFSVTNFSGGNPDEIQIEYLFA
jgi:hypothetical protein